MSIKSKIRNWFFPSKTDSFFDSYDSLLSFFNSTDYDVGNIIYFLFGKNIKYFFRNQQDLNISAGQGEFGLYMSTGEILIFQGNEWVHHSWTKIRPLIKDRDPNCLDWDYEKRTSWINEKTGKVFSFLGNIGLESDGSIEGIWVNMNGVVEHCSRYVKTGKFYPVTNFSFKTKTLHNNGDGTYDFNDNDIHLEGNVQADGSFQYLAHDTHVDLYSGDYLFDTLILSGREVYSYIDFSYFAPEGGLPEKGTPEIGPWYLKFERLLISFYLFGEINSEFKFRLKLGTKFSSTFYDILNSYQTLLELFSQNNETFPSEETIDELKEKFRSLVTGLSDEEVSIEDKKRIIYLLGECEEITSWDGNLYYLNGNEIDIDGNIQPTCL